jgi:hypothetical protein
MFLVARITYYRTFGYVGKNYFEKKSEFGKYLEGSGCQVVDNTMTFPRGTEENYEAFKTSGVLAEIQIDHLKKN